MESDEHHDDELETVALIQSQQAPQADEAASSSLVLRRTLALGLCTLYAQVCSVAYGLAFFPPGMAVPQALGIQMFVASTATCQAVLARMSTLSCATGLMMVENLPFMQLIATEVLGQLEPAGRGQAVLPTILAIHAASSVLIGAAFYALWLLGWSDAISAIPPHLVTGCMGGIGVFVLRVGVDASTGAELRLLSLDGVRALLSPPLLPLWGLSAAVVLLYFLIARRVRAPVLFSLYYSALPLAFHAARAAAGVGLGEARRLGLVYAAGGGEGSRDVLVLWRTLDVRAVAWDVLPSQLPTLAALTAFGVLHVPLNVPALSATTREKADVSAELRAHALSNLLAGCLGAPPNYLTYANSAVYYYAGGGGTLSRALLAPAFAALLLVGPSLVQLIPRCGCAAQRRHTAQRAARAAAALIAARPSPARASARPQLLARRDGAPPGRGRAAREPVGVASAAQPLAARSGVRDHTGLRDAGHARRPGPCAGLLDGAAITLTGRQLVAIL